ncbi:NAD+ diphosphatase [Cellulomonas marina]|uniref:NAD(+) diphosphatase n=1 Tax=Cellulomonas marina TaxID=988821 RepID=A0A1I1A3U6_9CELL|nr:NAD+ diphosphatase [Cellulomonas marina]
MSGVVLDELPLSRATVDRAADLRTRPGLVADALAAPTTRVLLVRDGAVAVVPVVEASGDGAGAAALDLRPATDVRGSAAADGAAATWLFLGREADGTLHLARSFSVDERLVEPDEVHRSDDGVHPGRDERAADAGAAGRAGTAVAPAVAPAVPAGEPVFAPLREVGARLGSRDAGLATTAVALTAWHARHPRCPRCGAATEVVQAGWARRCPVDRSEHYPRTDPAVIMAVVDADDRVLLGHSAGWPEGRFSTLAGFVEAGEPPEAAVRREVLEETGVHVGEVEYRGSQPWPFPASLMLGYRARATSTTVVPDGVEMTQARWFSREELAAAVRSGAVVLPGRSSIAHALIAEWYGQPLPPADPSTGG